MSDFEELLGRFTSAAAVDLPPLTAELVELCGASGNDDLARAIGAIVGRAFMAGVSRGNAEAVAQMVEQGMSIQMEMLRSDGLGT